MVRSCSYNLTHLSHTRTHTHKPLPALLLLLLLLLLLRTITCCSKALLFILTHLSHTHARTHLLLLLRTTALSWLAEADRASLESLRGEEHTELLG